jgi:predicted DNA-binding mobile mystery protein A
MNCFSGYDLNYFYKNQVIALCLSNIIRSYSYNIIEKILISIYMSLIIKQLDSFYSHQKELSPKPMVPTGWIRIIRQALGMTNSQLARILGITPQSASEIEKREAEGSITLKTLREVADKLDMEVEYVLRPKDGTLQQLIDRKATELATQIVLRTSQSMSLEDQAVSKQRIQEAIKERAAILKQTPKVLWN